MADTQNEVKQRSSFHAVPIGILGHALLFWGWQTGNLSIGIGIAVIIEGARFSRARWECDYQQLSRLIDFTIVGYLIALFLIYQDQNQLVRTTRIAAQWLPLAALPIVLVQYYTTLRRIDMRIFVIFLRKQLLDVSTLNNTDPRQSPCIHLSWPFLLLCLLSAGMAHTDNHTFYAGCCVIVAYALWPMRSKKRKLSLWIATLVGAIAMGVVGQLLLDKAQNVLSLQAGQWIHQIRTGGTKKSNTTAIGRPGTIELSDHIIMRVHTDKPLHTPVYLIDEVSNLLADFEYTWNPDSSAKTIKPDKDLQSWDLRRARHDGSRLTISTIYEKGSGSLLMTNLGTRIEDLKADSVNYNTMGFASVEGSTKLLNYDIISSNKANGRNKPRKNDLKVPRPHQKVITAVAKELKLRDMPAEDRPQAIRQYFMNFTYSLTQDYPPRGMSPLQAFLLKTQKGHCEYFATCTTLLLRETGIPARYVTGFAMTEYNSLEESYVVRGKDAHAWVQYYQHKRWHRLDTTPQGSTEASFFRPVTDIFDWLSFRFSTWRWGQTGRDQLIELMPWTALLFAIYLIWRFTHVKRSKKSATKEMKKDSNTNETLSFYGFERLEQALQDQGLSRYPWETPQQWLDRLKTLPDAAYLFPPYTPKGQINIEAIINKHKQLCYGKEKDNGKLKSLINSWLDYIGRKQ